MASDQDPPTGPSSPLLNLRTVKSLRDLPGRSGGSALAEILGLYRETAPPLLLGLRDALAAGDLRSAERVAHTLRGSALNLGGAALGALAGRLEDAAGGGDTAAARALLPEVEDLYRRTLEALGREAGA